MIRKEDSLNPLTAKKTTEWLKSCNLNGLFKYSHNLNIKFRNGVFFSHVVEVPETWDVALPIVEHTSVDCIVFDVTRDGHLKRMPYE